MKTYGAILAAAGLLGGAGLATAAEIVYGNAQPMGNAQARGYIAYEGDAPTAIGFHLAAGALEGLPPTKNATSRCFDLNKNAKIDGPDECEGDAEVKLDLPASAPNRERIPFRWMAVNWNAEGHPPPPWSVPHFDFHFYIAERNEIEMIRIGACQFFIDCDDKKVATLPLEDKYVASDHINVDAAVGRMGNHLIDKLTPELAEGGPPFTHTWIFGANDRRIIFYEPMITLAYLNGRPDGCHEIRQPAAWRIAGYYPTRYCIRTDAASGDHTISIEGLVYREAG